MRRRATQQQTTTHASNILVSFGRLRAVSSRIDEIYLQAGKMTDRQTDRQTGNLIFRLWTFSKQQILPS